jgi:hypothetical protein
MKRFVQRIKTRAYEVEIAGKVIARDAILSAAGGLIILGTLTDWFTYMMPGERVAISGIDLILRVGLYYEILILLGIGITFLLLPLTYTGRVRKVLPGDLIAGTLVLVAIIIPIEVAIRHRGFIRDTVGIELFNNLGAGFFLVLLGCGVIVISLIAHPPVPRQIIKREPIEEEKGETKPSPPEQPSASKEQIEDTPPSPLA